MSERLQHQPRISLSRDAPEDKTPPAESAHRRDQDDDSIFYANFCLDFCPVHPLEFYAFARGQMMAMAIFVPAAIALFIFFAA